MKINNHVIGGFDQGEKKENKNISVDDFLKIMAAEISNQNPMGGEGGGSKGDYLTQLAQFTTLEQINEISASMNVLALMNQQQSALTLVGKEVKLVDDQNQEFTGIVDKVKFANGFTTVEVDGKDYHVSALVEVNK